MKPGALVFFVFNEDYSKNLKELTTFGHFLYGPTEITLKDMFYDKTIPTVLEVPIVDSGCSFFGVWQKSNSNLNQETSSTVKLLSVTPVSVSPKPLNDINIIESDRAQSISKLENPFKLPKPSNSKLTEAISSENVSISTESSVLLKSASTKPKLICENQANFVKKMQEIGNACPSTSTDSVAAGQKIKPSKNNPTNPESSLNSLVKTLERLVTNLEEFVNLQNSVSNPPNQQCYFTCPAESWNTRHNCNGCFQKSCCSPCVQNHHICSSSYNYCNRSMPNKHNCCQNVRSQSPCIVIPLQNTTETALAQVCSLVSQVNNPSN